MKRIALFLAQGVEAFEASAFTDVMGWTMEVGADPIHVTAIGLRQKITCAWGLTIVPQALVSSVDPAKFDALAIPGGFRSKGYLQDAYEGTFIELIRQFAKNRKLIASICLGALPLAKSGVLTNRNATIYPTIQLQSEMKKMGAIISDRRMVSEGNIITSNGPATAVDVALETVKILSGESNVRKVKEAMGFLVAD